MKNYVWVLKISHLNNSPRILCDEYSTIFNSEDSARNAMIKLHEKTICKENCKIVSEDYYPRKGFTFISDDDFYGVQIVRKQILSEVDKLNSIYSVFL